MKTFIKCIGVTDKDNRVHKVDFTSGVNVITGRSSTGKSALIEIFDYCFGNGDFTVPEGVITEYAQFYFIVLQIGETWVVLARREDDTKHAFIKQENDELISNGEIAFTDSFFEDCYFISLEDFKKELRKYFGPSIQITDIDESQESRRYRGNRKKSTPSVRSFTSFMLQHQNLVANKHAIFYRFDEEKKREQVIDHFKVFAGFADQEYFLKVQELENLRIEERQLSIQIPKQSDVKARKKKQIEDALAEYSSNSGEKLDIGNDLDSVVTFPQVALNGIRQRRVRVTAISDEHAERRAASERRIAVLTAKYRKQQNIAKDIESSIEFAENYRGEAKNTPTPLKAELHASKCPFCMNQNNSIENCANDMQSAIDWLNDELQKSQFSLDSFREDLQKAQGRIKELAGKIEAEQSKLSAFDKQIKDLEQFNTQRELAMKVKVRIEAFLEELIEKPYARLEDRLSDIKKSIKGIEKSLKEKYDIKAKIKEAEDDIAKYMAEITPNLDFEKSYRPINLKFSLDSFDLRNEKDEKSIFLRSMGSGANWLSCHVALFLALNRYFCELGEKCAIPTTLFFDQPSQVYFPAVLDAGDQFSPKDIADKEVGRVRLLDDDLKAVTQLYSELVHFCKATLDATGIEPQIIVTDHADHLDLNGDGSTEAFEALVNGRRWRMPGTGFIAVEDQDKSE